MNVNNLINKLLTALASEGIFYKINTFKKYYKEDKKFITRLQLCQEFEVESEIPGETKKKYIEILSTYSKIDILKLLAEDYKELQKEKQKKRGENVEE